MRSPRLSKTPPRWSASFAWGPLLVAAACLGACGGGDLSAVAADGGAHATTDGGDGGVGATGGGACGIAPTGVCPNASDFFCGNGNCCDSGHPYFCSSSGLCYATVAQASAVCGASCGACSAPAGGGSDAGTGASDAGTGGGASCSPPAQPGSCGGSDLSCGAGNCCHSQFPFFCASTMFCYAKQADATAACGGSCSQCVTPVGGATDGGSGGNDAGTGGGGSCAPPAQPGSCSGSDLTCGGGNCCHSQFPYFCASTMFCYAKQADAAAACGSSCGQCVPPTGGGTDGGGGGGGGCAPAPTGASCNAGDVVCGTGACCHSQFPFYCAAKNLCYGTQADAEKACGTSCLACH